MAASARDAGARQAERAFDGSGHSCGTVTKVRRVERRFGKPILCWVLRCDLGMFANQEQPLPDRRRPANGKRLVHARGFFPVAGDPWPVKWNGNVCHLLLSWTVSDRARNGSFSGTVSDNAISGRYCGVARARSPFYRTPMSLRPCDRSRGKLRYKGPHSRSTPHGCGIIRCWAALKHRG